MDPGTLSYIWQSSSDEITWTEIGADSTYTITSSEEGKKVRVNSFLYRWTGVC